MERWTRGPTRGVLNLLVIMGFLAGCLPETRREVAPPKAPHVQPLPISAEAVEARSTRLSELLDRKDASEQDKKVAKQLLQTYEVIREALERPPHEQEKQRVMRLLFDSLGNLDDAYFAKEGFDETAYPRVFQIYAAKRAKILKDHLAGDHEGVINDCIAMEQVFGKEALMPEIGLLFSAALARRGRLNDAIKLGEKILREMEGRPDQFHLRAHVLEWQLATGQERGARESLDKLIQSAAETENLVKEARLRLGAGEEETLPPKEEVSASAPSEGAPAAMETLSLEKLLADVDQLIRQREFTKAKFLLLQQKIRFQEGPETEEIDNAMRKVEAAEREAPAVVTPGQPELPKGEDEGIRTAKRLIEEENFEEALAKLEELQQQGNLDPETARLREEAIERLISRERNRAAKLYLMARNTADRAKKEELLVASHAILQNILKRYPLSPLSAKINDNIARIKEELERVKKNPG